MDKKQKVFFFFLFFVFFIFWANFTLAIEFRAPEINYPSLPFPGVKSPQVFLKEIQEGKIPGEQALPLYVKYFYYLFLMIAGLLALGVIIYGGFLYLISAGAPVKMIAAKDQITGGILGLVILLSSYLILATIGPQLVILRLPGLEKITLPEIKLSEPGEKKLPTYFQIPFGMIIENAVLNETGQGKLNNAKKAAEDARESAEYLKNLTEELKNLAVNSDCGLSKCNLSTCTGLSCPQAQSNIAEITKKIEEINGGAKLMRVSLTPGEIISGIGFVPTGGYCSVDNLSKFWTKEALGPLWHESLPIEAAMICDCESGGIETRRNYNPPIEDSRGLFQINVLAHTQFDPEKLYEPKYNIAAAITIYNNRGRWGLDWVNCSKAWGLH